MKDKQPSEPKRRPLPASIRGEIRRQQMAPAGYRYTKGRTMPSLPVFNLPPVEVEDE